MHYRVYVWKSRHLKTASVVQEVQAPSVDDAIHAVLLHSWILKAAYVWVVSSDDESVDVHRYNVHFSSEHPTLLDVIFL